MGGRYATRDIVVTINGVNDTSIAALDYTTVQKGATVSIDARHGVLANDSDADAHDTLHVIAVNGSSSNVGQTIKGIYGSLILNSDGSYSYKASSGGTKSGQDIFTYTVDDGHGGTASSTLVIDVKKGALLSAQSIFAGAGGEAFFLAELANASYHLGAFELAAPGYNNVPSTLAQIDYTSIGASLTWLNTNIPELSGLTPTPTGDPHYPYTGLSFDGIYANQNAAALVGRSADSLFIAIRGTNDLSGLFDLAAGTPDVDQWFSASPSDEGMDNYYALLQPLFTALDAYINNPANGIAHIYVTGHSLGAAMVQRYMYEHLGDARFETITFADPGYQFLSDFSDSRITNIQVSGDVIGDIPTFLAYGNGGDTYLIQHPAVPNANSTDLHSMDLYQEVAGLLSSQGGLWPLQQLVADAGANTGSFFANITRDSKGWHASLPNGTVQGTPGDDLIIMGGGPDVLLGAAGADTLKGNAGSDLIEGGPGSDTLIGGNGHDVFRYNDINEGLDHIVDFGIGDGLDFSHIASAMGLRRAELIPALSIHHTSQQMQVGPPTQVKNFGIIPTIIFCTTMSTDLDCSTRQSPLHN